ncbi:reverse transcriptase domain-containing protein [Tanacetum coccineum]
MNPSKAPGSISRTRSNRGVHEAYECSQNNPTKQGNNKRKEKGEDGPEWVVKNKFEDELVNFMLEKKLYTKGIGEMLDQHRKEMHEQFSQILSIIGESKILKPEASTFAITTRSGISTRDPPFPTLLQSTPTNHTEGITEREGPEGTELSTIVKKQKKDDENERLLSIFKQIHIDLPFLEAMIRMPNGDKVLKDLLSCKEKLEKEASSVKISEECSIIIQRSLPQKEGDPGSFILPCLIGPLAAKNALADLGTSDLRESLGKGEQVHLSSRFHSFGNGWRRTEAEEEEDSNEVQAVSLYPRTKSVEPLEWKALENWLKPSSVEPPELELKELPEHLEYAFLQENNQLSVVISSALSTVEKARLLKVLNNHKGSLGESCPGCPKERRNDRSKKEKNELIPQRTVTGWRICIDYHKLNNTTRKDHFPLPFIDQMLKRLAWHEYYCFLDGFIGYFQIPISLEDQEKTTFTCPYGTFTYKRMPLLCNAPITFQRYMTAIFYELIEDSMEVFMDDFPVFGSSFDHCLKNLEKMLKRCSGIEVDKAKIKAISKLPYPTNVKAIRSFLGHAGFYRRFIKDFLHVAHPMTQLLVKDAPFNFSEECIQAFDNDYAAGAVLGQRIKKHFKPIHYASKRMNEAQENYTTTEKELLVIVFAFDKFLQYLVLSKTIVFTDHSTLRLFARFGIPKALISDRGTHFCNYRMEKEMKRYGVVHRFSTAYHPQINGQVVNTNRAIKRILEKTIENNMKDWSHKLDDALWAFRIAFKTPLGTTPFRIIYDKACHLPVEFKHKAYWAIKNCNMDLTKAGANRF